MDRLLERADQARLAGRHAEAVGLLARASQSHPHDRRAAIADFTRGRIHADELQEPARAAQAFSTAIARGLPDSLRETAWLRLVETRVKAGDREGAREAARQHRQLFPSGRYTDAIQRTIGEP
jgi:hypothetical protein